MEFLQNAKDFLFYRKNSRVLEIFRSNITKLKKFMWSEYLKKSEKLKSFIFRKLKQIRN